MGAESPSFAWDDAKWSGRFVPETVFVVNPRGWASSLKNTNIYEKIFFKSVPYHRRYCNTDGEIELYKHILAKNIFNLDLRFYLETRSHRADICQPIPSSSWLFTSKKFLKIRFLSCPPNSFVRGLMQILVSKNRFATYIFFIPTFQPLNKKI